MTQIPTVDPSEHTITDDGETIRVITIGVGISDSAALAAETAARQQADALEQQTRIAQDGLLHVEVVNETNRATVAEQNEASARASTDATLSGQIAVEESARAAGDTVETARATASEGAIAANLDAETTRAESAEASIATSVSDEATRALASEATLQNELDAETAARVVAESNEASARAAADATNANATATEATARAGADTTLQTNIAAEATARAAADALLIPTAKINDTSGGGVAGIDPATGHVYSSLLPPGGGGSQTFFVADQAARLALAAAVADHAIQTDNSHEYVLQSLPASTNGNWLDVTGTGGVSSVNGRAGAVTGLAEQSSLDAETSARTTAVSGEATTRANADTTNANAIAAETTARTTADTTLQTNINNEAATRAAADATNANAITAEATARTNADATNASAIAAEASTRATADTTNANAIAAEATRATTAEGTKVNVAAVGAANGVASLDGAGLVPETQLPPKAIRTLLGHAPDEATMLAFVAQRGDWCIRDDLGVPGVGEALELIADDPTQVANWQAYPQGLVQSVNGQIGDVVGLAEQVDLDAAIGRALAAEGSLWSALGGVALVQRVAAQATNATAQTTIAATVGAGGATVGHTLLIVGEYLSATAPTITVTDDHAATTNVYVVDGRDDKTDGTKPHTFIARCPVTTALAPGDHVNVAWSAGVDYPAVRVYEYAGLLASPLDVTAHAHGTAPDPTVTAPWCRLGFDFSQDLPWHVPNATVDPTYQTLAEAAMATLAGEFMVAHIKSFDTYNEIQPRAGAALDFSVIDVTMAKIAAAGGVKFVSLNQAPDWMKDAPESNDADDGSRAWVAGTTYAAKGSNAKAVGNTVWRIDAAIPGSGAVQYVSLQNGNVGHDPLTSPTWWAPSGFYGNMTIRGANQSFALLTPSVAHYDDFATLCAAVVVHVNPYAVSVWQELTSLFTHATSYYNQGGPTGQDGWNMLSDADAAKSAAGPFTIVLNGRNVNMKAGIPAGYVALFDRVYTAIKAAAPGVFVGGPYNTSPPIGIAGPNPSARTDQPSGAWGWLDNRTLDSLEYFARNVARNGNGTPRCDFLCWDGRSFPQYVAAKNFFPGQITDPVTAQRKYQAFNNWVAAMLATVPNAANMVALPRLMMESHKQPVGNELNGARTGGQLPAPPAPWTSEWNEDQAVAVYMIGSCIMACSGQAGDTVHGLSGVLFWKPQQGIPVTQDVDLGDWRSTQTGTVNGGQATKLTPAQVALQKVLLFPVAEVTGQPLYTGVWQGAGGYVAANAHPTLAADVTVPGVGTVHLGAADGSGTNVVIVVNAAPSVGLVSTVDAFELVLAAVAYAGAAVLTAGSGFGRLDHDVVGARALDVLADIEAASGPHPTVQALAPSGDWSMTVAAYRPTPGRGVSSVNGRAGAVVGLAEQSSLDAETTARVAADAGKAPLAVDESNHATLSAATVQGDLDQIDTLLAAYGLAVKLDAVWATTAPLPAYTLVSPVQGLKAVANGALVLDGHTCVAGDVGKRVLVKDEDVLHQMRNGLFTIVAPGDASTQWELTRATDLDGAAEVPWATVKVTGGATNAKTTWSVLSAGPFSVGSSPIVWTRPELVFAPLVGDLDAGGHRVVNAADGIVGTDLVTVEQLAGAAKFGGLRFFSHSYNEIAGNGDRVGIFSRRVASALGIPSQEVFIFGVSGAQASSPSLGDGGSSAGVGQVLRWWYPIHTYSGVAGSGASKANPGIVLFMLGINDPVRDWTVWATFGRTAYKHGLRTMISRARARRIWLHTDAAIVYTGTWSTVGINYASAAAVHRTSTNGDSFTFTIPKTFRGGTIAICVHANLNGSAANLTTAGARVNWTGTSSINGAPAFNISGQGTGGTRIQAVYRFALTSADAGKTIIGSLGSLAGAETLDLDAIWVEDDEHAGVGLINQPVGFPYATTASFFTADGAQANADLASVVAEFAPGNVYVVDIATEMDARYNATLQTALAADATLDHVGQHVHITPLNAAKCVIDIGSLLRLDSGEVVLVTAIVKTSNSDWNLTCTRNVTAATTSDFVSTTTNVAAAINHPIGDTLPWRTDGVHPSDFGHELIARLVLDAIGTWTASTLTAAAGSSYALGHAPHAPELDAYYYTLGGVRTTLGSGNSADGRAYAQRIEVLEEGLLLDLSHETTVLASAGGKTRLCIYYDSESGGPGNLLKDTGTVVTDFATGVLGTASVQIAMRRGFYWLVAIPQGASTTRATYRSTTDVRPTRDARSAQPLGTAFADTNCIYLDGVVGSVPNPFGTPTGTREGTTAAVSFPTVVAHVYHPLRSD